MADQLTASFNAQSYGGRIEGGYRFAVTPASGITPYAALQAQSFRTPSYMETDVNGGGFGLGFNARNATDTRSEVGARFEQLAAIGGYLLTLHGRLAWAHDFLSDPTLSAAFQALPGASFIVNGASPARDHALTTLGADYRLAPNWVLSAKFEGQFAAKSQTYAGVGKMVYSW
jgi:outer membrane autotransporter protein